MFDPSNEIPSLCFLIAMNYIKNAASFLEHIAEKPDNANCTGTENINVNHRPHATQIHNYKLSLLG